MTSNPRQSSIDKLNCILRSNHNSIQHWIKQELSHKELSHRELSSFSKNVESLKSFNSQSNSSFIKQLQSNRFHPYILPEVLKRKSKIVKQVSDENQPIKGCLLKLKPDDSSKNINKNLKRVSDENQPIKECLLELKSDCSSKAIQQVNDENQPIKGCLLELISDGSSKAIQRVNDENQPTTMGNQKTIENNASICNKQTIIKNVLSKQDVREKSSITQGILQNGQQNNQQNNQQNKQLQCGMNGIYNKNHHVNGCNDFSHTPIQMWPENFFKVTAAFSEMALDVAKLISSFDNKFEDHEKLELCDHFSFYNYLHKNQTLVLGEIEKATKQKGKWRNLAWNTKKAIVKNVLAKHHDLYIKL